MTEPASGTGAQQQIPPAQHLMQMVSGYMVTAAIYTAAKYNIADLLAAGPRPVSELAEEAWCNADALYRVLRALVSVGIFAEVAPKNIALTPAAEYLRAGVPGSKKDLVLWLGNSFNFQTWAALPHAVRTGKPVLEHLYGKPGFECILSMPEVAHDFNHAMTNISADIAPAVLEAYDFSSIRTLMDVAGGHGLVLCSILKDYPQMKGILFDLESVVEGAKSRLHDLKMEHRCTLLAGSFFEHIPDGADGYYLQHVIHDWDDENAVRILGNCRKALEGRKDGRLLVVDCVIPENSHPHPGKLIDLQMLLMPGGRERTEQEFRDLFGKAGFKITRIVPTRVRDNLIEARLM